MTIASHGDATSMRAAIALSRRARDRGNAPYGAVLVDATGRVLLEAQNTEVTDADCTAHAELNLVREAARRFDRAKLGDCAVFASGEPCPMCAGAIYWSGVGRVVFALSLDSMIALGGESADELDLHCADVLARGKRSLRCEGPLLESEARSALGIG